MLPTPSAVGCMLVIKAFNNISARSPKLTGTESPNTALNRRPVSRGRCNGVKDKSGRYGATAGLPIENGCHNTNPRGIPPAASRYADGGLVLMRKLNDAIQEYVAAGRLERRCGCWSPVH